MDRFTTSAASADEPVIVSQSQEVDAVDDEDNACEVTLSECRPKVGGRSFVWKQKLFLVDKNSRAVCGHCGDVVPARDGNTRHFQPCRTLRVAASGRPRRPQAQFVLTACKRGDLQSLKVLYMVCPLYTSPSPRDLSTSRMPSSA